MNDLSGEASLHHQIPLCDAGLLHGLDISASNFRAEEDFNLDDFMKHRWYSGNTKRDKSSSLQAWNVFILNVQEAKLGLINLTARVRFDWFKRQSCIICLVRQEFQASYGATRVRVVSTILNA